MKGFVKELSPSKRNANRNLSSSGSMENNENDSSVDKMISQFENHKIIHGKDSASGAPKKKILAEIYEIPCVSDDQNHENPNMGLEKSSYKKGVSDSVACYSHASVLKDDSFMKAYDHLNNCLSPRPKFLRFNPNRSHEILKKLENEGRNELNSSPCHVEVNDDKESSAMEVEESSPLSPPKVCVVNPRTGGTSEEDNDHVLDGYEEEEEEEEEIEEERGWCLRGALKLLVTLIACLLSTSYICSMNSPTSSPIQQAIWNLKDSALLIKYGSIEFHSTKMHDAFFEVEVGGNGEAEVEKQSYGEIDKSFEAETVETLEHYKNFEIDESIEAEDEEVDEQSYGEIVEILERFEREVMNANEDSGTMVDEAPEVEGIRAAQFEFKEDEYEHLFDAETDENVDDGVIWLDDEVESSYTGLVEHEASEREIIGFSDMDFKQQSSGQLKGEKIFESHGELSDSIEEMGDDAQVGKDKSEWNAATIIGVSAVLIVLTSLAIINHLKKSRSTSCKVFEPVLEQNLAAEENANPVLPSIERKVEFLARASLPSHLTREEAPREVAHHIHAPRVQLMGEIVVGRPNNSRGSGKFKMTISEEECNATLHQMLSATELHPTTSNTSYGSYTTERRTSKKEGGQSREAMIETTPVRRSSRLRSRSAVKSP